MSGRNFLWLLITAVHFVAPVEAYTDNKNTVTGVHCGNTTDETPTTQLLSNSTGVHYHCVQCLFYQNCLQDNVCREGSYGNTCEKCLRGQTSMDGWVRVGNSCTPCPSIPWSLVAFAVYMLLLAFSGFYHGFTESVATKMKLLCHHMQLVALTFHIKVDWPLSLLQCLVIIDFSSFNSKMAVPACSLPSLSMLQIYVLEWSTTMLIPSLALLFYFTVDKCMTYTIEKEKSSSGSSFQRWQTGRTLFRRILYFVLIVMYMPIAQSAGSSFLCSNMVPADLVLHDNGHVFLLDNDITCSSFLFQIVHLWGALFLIAVVMLFPFLLIFFTLRMKKWKFLSSRKYLYGHVYETYKDRFCFWDAVPLLRKLICFSVTDLYPVSPFIQSLVYLSLSGVYLLAVVMFRPFRPRVICKFVNVHLTFEVGSNIVLCLLQSIAFLLTLDLYIPLLEDIALICIIAVLVIWVILLLSLQNESKDDSAEETMTPAESGSQESTEADTENKQTGKTSILKTFSRRNKVEPEYQKELEQRQKVLNEF